MKKLRCWRLRATNWRWRALELRNRLLVSIELIGPRDKSLRELLKGVVGSHADEVFERGESMTEAQRCQEALQLLRKTMQARLDESRDQLQFAPEFDDLVYWSQVIAYGLGELRSLEKLEESIPPSGFFIEHLYARAETTVRAVHALRGGGSMAEVLDALEAFDKSVERSCSALLGRGQLDRWVAIRRWTDHFRSGLWRLVALEMPRQEGETI